MAARKNKRIVTLNEFEEAKDKVMMGAERRSMVMTEDEKKLTDIMKGVMHWYLLTCQVMILYIKQL